MIRYENVNRNKLHTELQNAGIKTDYVGAIDGTQIGCEIEFQDGTDMTSVQQIVDSHDPTPLPQPLSEIDQLRIEQAQSNAELFEMMLMLTGGGL